MRSRKAGKKRRSTVGTLVLVVLLAIMGFELFHVGRQISTAQAEERALSQQVEKRQQENDALQSDLSRSDDPEFYKQLARNELNLAEQGERIFYDVNH